jgi:NAD(P)H-dependent FMN reductase
MTSPVRILLFSGSTRKGSTNTALLETARDVAPEGKPVAWINAAPAGRGEGARAALETVLGYVGATVVESACVRLPVPREAVGSDGLIADPSIRASIADVLEAMLRQLGGAAD